MYIGFLLSEPNGVSCSRLVSVLSISHDSANRFLHRESYEPRDLYREVEPTIEKGTLVQVQTLDIPSDGLVVWLRDFGQVKLFRTHLKDQVRHYAMYLPENTDQPDDGEQFDTLNQVEFDKLHSQHWQIEQYHRAIKQVCNIESFQVRGKTAVKNHLFAAICSYVELQRLRAVDVISNCYRLRRELFNEIIASFVNTFIQNKEHLNPKFQAGVNA